MFTADGTPGTFAVTITIGPAITTASYTLTNFGPTAANGSISGRIVDGQGTPVAGVTIKLNGGQTRRAITDAAGNYRFDDIETGAFYTLRHRGGITALALPIDPLVRLAITPRRALPPLSAASR